MIKFYERNNTSNSSVAKQPDFGGGLKSLAKTGALGFIPKLAVSFLEDLENDKLFGQKIPGGTKAGIARAKKGLKQDPLQYTPASFREKIVPATRVAGKVLNNEQAAEDIGYGLRGALSITPFQRPKDIASIVTGGEKSKQIQASEPTTERQKIAEDVGRTAYGTALTYPIGGVKGILTRVPAGAAFGAGISTGSKIGSSVIGEGKLPSAEETLEAAKQGASSGVQNSWVLAFTGMGLDKVLSTAATKVPALAQFTGANMGAPFKALQTAAPEVKGQLFAEGAKRLLGRAVLETLPENTAFTLLNRISGKEKEKFFDAWVRDLPYALLSNIIYSGAQVAKGRVYDWNKQDIDGAVNAVKTALKEADISDIPLGNQTKPVGGMNAVFDADKGTQVFRATDSTFGANQAAEGSLEPSLGSGRYYSFDENSARVFGNKIETGTVSPEAKILDLSNPSKYQAFTDQATKTPTFSEKGLGVAMKELAQSQGYDGIKDDLNLSIFNENVIQGSKSGLSSEDFPFGMKAQDISKQVTEGATQQQLNALEKIRTGKQNEVDLETFDNLQTFLRGKGFELDQGKIIPTGTGVDTRPPHQAQLEQASQANDWVRVGKILDAIPEGDPYKQSMESIFRQQVQNDPVVKIVNALEEAKPVRGKQETLYQTERARRAGAIAGVGESIPGEAGYKAQLGELKGELPKAEFEGVRNKLEQTDIDSLFNRIEQSDLQPYEKITAKNGLAKLLGVEGGTVPTKSEIKLMNEVFPSNFTEAVLDKRPRSQKLLSEVMEIANVPRALMASIDMSAPLRQGIFLVGRPKQWIPAFKDMIKYFFNEDAYQSSIKEIEARPTYKLMEENGLALTKVDDPFLEGREEMFMSNLAQKIPGIGAGVRASDRAYTGFLNKLRADVFDDMIKTAQTSGVEITPELTSSAAKFVNSATGRGDLGALNRASVVLNSVFFSPRLMASRINLLNPKYYADLDPYVRKEAIKSLLSFAGTAVGVLTLAKMGGADVVTEPTSADFGKIKVGNTRYDILGGFQQYIKLGAQLLTGKITSTTTGKEIILNEETYKPITRLDVLQRFLSSKESPVLSFAMGMLSGQDALGEKFEVGPEIASRFIPLFFQDMYELAEDRGPGGLPMAIPGFFGVGSQTYGEKIPVEGFTESGRPTIKFENKPGLAESIIDRVTGKPASNFSEQQQKSMWEAEEQRRLQQAEKDKIDRVKRDMRMGKISAEEGQRQILSIQKGESGNVLETVIPGIFGAPDLNVQNQSSGRNVKVYTR